MALSEKTDEEIATNVQQGDGESFGVLVERYERKLTRYARKFLSQGEDIQDLLQEVFIKSYVNIKSFDANRKFSSWIYRIAHNEFVNALKKKSRTPVLSFDLDVLFPHLAAPETADGEAEKKEVKHMLNRSLAKLPARYRETLVLHYFEEMGYEEIAEIMQVPMSTVGARLRRGKLFLRKVISQAEN